MKHYFSKTFEFEFEIRRLLWIAPSGGADFAEVATTTDRIKSGNYESWYHQWKATAEQVAQQGRLFHSETSQKNALFRASRYYQAAEFFLSPNDSRKLEVYELSKKLFYEALDLEDITYEINIVNYGKIPLRTLFFPLENSKGTIYMCGGFDALLEELFFVAARAALEQGYQVVLHEAPGQSDTIRYHNVPFDAEWHKPTRSVIDFYQSEKQLSGTRIGLGLSLGGLLLGRAASLDDTLFDKVILYNYFPSMIEIYKNVIPKILHGGMKNGFNPAIERIIQTYVRSRPFTNWQFEHAKWTFGADTFSDLLNKVKAFDETVAYTQLQTPTLVLAARHDNYYDSSLAEVFYSKLPAKNKKLVLFDDKDHYSSLHCQNGAYYESIDQIFEFLS